MYMSYKLHTRNGNNQKVLPNTDLTKVLQVFMNKSSLLEFYGQSVNWIYGIRRLYLLIYL